ncbi:YciI family protein [Rhodococcus chondri]|uniref:YciI family protein n=1 Tax=Rhodococcus chondri TaxID=3065941 RepID=A0ABU7JML8_9NOCA|nr:YciI family protein [Rhodococcus sp. CC-R104]MEE2031060.1 YciI family protein [Rhodococcus sp. CC-R104]
MALFAVEYTYSDKTAGARDERRPDHRGWLSGLVADGTVLATGPWTDGTGALIVIDVADEAAARELMAQDPFAQADLIDAVRITGWLPVMGVFND